jgi:hypothetical protein
LPTNRSESANNKRFSAFLQRRFRRAFLACEGNELMTAFDLEKHRPIAFLPLAKGPDVVKYDAGLKRIYVACYSGAISVFQEDDPDHFRKLEDFFVQKKVHSLAVDQDTYRLYAPEQEADGHPAARMAIYEAVASQAATLRWIQESHLEPLRLSGG